jgi:hypothetical protein
MSLLKYQGGRRLFGLITRDKEKEYTSNAMGNFFHLIPFTK